MSKKTAVVLFNLGGPDQQKSVRKFLFNLFNDKAIIGLAQPFRCLLALFISSVRNKKAMEIYAQIGGKSPILEITNSQAEALEKELSFLGNYKVFTSMRYWHPMNKEVVQNVKKYAPDEIILLPLYPQFSTTTTNSSFDDFYKYFKKQKLSAQIKYICCYPTNPHFILAHSRLIKQGIAKTKSAGFNDFRLLFSAHGLPQKVIDGGDPYVFQVESSVKSIIENLQEENLDYKICYQSKVGPMEWTKPSLEFEISRAALDQKPVIVIPIAFVSEHSETLVELDIEYKKMAEEKKIPFYLRIPAFNADGYFVKSLVDLCRYSSNGNMVCSGGNYGERICPKKFSKCINFNI